MKNRYLALFLVFVMILGFFAVVGCQGDKATPGSEPGKPGDGTSTAPSGKKFKVGISLMNREQSFYKDLESAFKEAAEKNNIELEIRDAQFDSSKQLSGIETLLVGKLDALIICPVDSKAIGAAIKKANKDKVPVFTVDIAAEKGDVVSHIASDNEEGGKKAAKYMAEALKGKGKIVILDSPQVTSVQERVKGFKDELKKFPDMEIISDIDGGAKQGTAMKTMENILQANKVIDGVFAINDETALGALRAIELAKRYNIVIIGYDATPPAREAIMKGGPLKADVVQYPKKMAEMAIDVVVKNLKGEKTAPRIPVFVGILDKKALENGESGMGEVVESKPPVKKPEVGEPTPPTDVKTPPEMKPGEGMPPGDMKPGEGKPEEMMPPSDMKPGEGKDEPDGKKLERTPM